MTKANILIIAEAGINHNGKLKNAKKLINIAKNSGADFVKFQIFNTKHLINKKIFNKKINFKTITILAETSTGCILSSDLTFVKKTIKSKEYAEYCRKIFLDFLEQFINGNCIDGYNQVFFFYKFN